MFDLGILDAAVHEFSRRLPAVGTARWGLPTPCDGWTVQDLVEHVVEGNELAVSLLVGDGAGADNDGGRAPADLISDFHHTVDRQRAAFDGADPTLKVAHPAGRITAAQFARYRAADIVVHAWDLARAVGADDRLPDRLIEHALTPYVQWVATLEADGMFGAGSSGRRLDRAQDRLLDRLGRRP